MDLTLVSVIFLVLFRLHAMAEGLSYNFYDQSCPQVKQIVTEAVRSASVLDPTTPAALLRLMFHDCQVQGCDGSILLDPDGKRMQSSEMASSRNFGIRKREFISMIKTAVEAECPQQVSCADLIVMAAREAVAFAGGPRINIPLGRRDTSNPPNLKLVDVSLPPADSGLDFILHLFAKKGMTVEESVAILGAHTLGITHCINLQSRLYIDPSIENNNEIINPIFESMLRMKCPMESFTSKISFVKNDLTPVSFDNQYFVNLMIGRGVLRVDAELPYDSRTRPFVQKFANDEEAFFRAFGSAFVKLSSSGVLTGSRGVIRRTCSALS